MNFSNSSNIISCWQRYGHKNNSLSTTQQALVSILSISAFCNIISCIWCAITTIATVKLRKPTWIFKASSAIKDVILSCMIVAFIIRRIISSTSEQKSTLLMTTEYMYDWVQFLLDVLFIMCLSSSFVHILLITFDRHQVISRPFRYHTGELLPSNVAYMLVIACWMFSLVIGITVTSETAKKANTDKNIQYVGAVIRLYNIPTMQKWLLGTGMVLVYLTSAGLLISAFSIEWDRAQRRKAVISGVGDIEPVRSRNNSVCQSLNRKGNPFVFPGTSSEVDANEFLLTAGGVLNAHCKKDEWNEEATIFTPAHYRPSLRRRIRDTWSLYSAFICFAIFTLLAAIPFLFIMFYFSSSDQDNQYIGRASNHPTAYCVITTVCECLLLLQGFAYVTVYVIIDDIFRPYFLKPFRKLHCKKQPKIPVPKTKPNRIETTENTSR